MCNLHIHGLIERYPALQKKGLHILAFFESPRESILKYVGRQNPPFPLIPDPDRKVYRAYGVESSWAKYAKALFKGGKMIKALKLGFLPGKFENDVALVPADILLDPDLVVKRAYYGKDIADHIPFAELEKLL